MDLICGKCGVKLEKMKTTFKYLKNEFSEETYKCPECGQVYLDEDLVRGKMAEVETTLEDK